jgi:hypothetical protein
VSRREFGKATRGISHRILLSLNITDILYVFCEFKICEKNDKYTPNQVRDKIRTHICSGNVCYYLDHKLLSNPFSRMLKQKITFEVILYENGILR